MVCNNTIVKLQVYDLLCALCMFSEDGMVFVKSVLSHIKVLRLDPFGSKSFRVLNTCGNNNKKFSAQINQKLQHDCEIVVTELQQADTFAYQTSLMAFVNCLIIVEQDPRKRMRVRNELLSKCILIYVTIVFILMWRLQSCFRNRIFLVFLFNRLLHDF